MFSTILFIIIGVILILCAKVVKKNNSICICYVQYIKNVRKSLFARQICIHIISEANVPFFSLFLFKNTSAHLRKFQPFTSTIVNGI